MVNDRFPARISYGFELVDASDPPILPPKSPSIENLHRIKSFGFFAKFRRIKLNANTCDLSTAVSQGLIARSTATMAISVAHAAMSIAGTCGIRKRIRSKETAGIA